MGHLEEDQFDHTYLDDIAIINPDVDALQTKRGLSRMGSRHMFPSLGGLALPSPGASTSRQYSIGSGYVPTDRVVLGRRLSTVLEQSRKMDPSSSNIMQHVLGSRSAESSLGSTLSPKAKTSPPGPLKMWAVVPPSRVKKVPPSKREALLPSEKKETIV